MGNAVTTPSPDLPARPAILLCSRDGLELKAKPTGGYKHKGGRWTARSCGQDPDPITYIEYLERNPHVMRHWR